MNKERGISDIFSLSGIVSQGILNIVVNQGGIPERGPGSFSVPNALKRQEASRKQGSTTLEERRAHNRNLFRKR